MGVGVSKNSCLPHARVLTACVVFIVFSLGGCARRSENLLLVEWRARYGGHIRGVYVDELAYPRRAGVRVVLAREFYRRPNGLALGCSLWSSV
jgi:hypothetical protein